MRKAGMDPCGWGQQVQNHSKRCSTRHVSLPGSASSAGLLAHFSIVRTSKRITTKRAFGNHTEFGLQGRLSLETKIHFDKPNLQLTQTT